MIKGNQENLKPHFSLRSLSQATLITLTLAAGGASASDPGDEKDLNSYLCKDVMRFSGEDRKIALGLLHGYVLGKDNKTVFNPDALAKITDNFMDYCLDHPDEKALAVFERTAKSE